LPQFTATRRPTWTSASSVWPEHKSGIAYTPRDGFDELRATFEEVESVNEERLGALVRKRFDVLLEAKVDRINAALDLQTKRMDKLALRQARPALEGRGASSVTSRAARRAVSRPRIRPMRWLIRSMR
jgi:predicted phage gp36 major capsid-like protein